MAGSRPVVILGPTASGKSELAMALAHIYAHSYTTHPYKSTSAKSTSAMPQVSFEIISADSMQVYRGMDIGTAKPAFEDQLQIRHHCIDLVNPDMDFSLKLYKQSADLALQEITGKTEKVVPLIVGGTGLYLRAVIDNLQIPRKYPEVRRELEGEKNTEILWNRLKELDPPATENILPDNRRRIIRALEVSIGGDRPFSSYGEGLKKYKESNFLQIGIRLPREKLDERIEERYELQMEAGFLIEVKSLSKMNLSGTARQALGYKELLGYLNGEMDLSQALDAAIRRTKKFARRQERWFRRDPRIHWIDAENPKRALSGILASGVMGI